MVVQVGLFSGHFGRFNISVTKLHEQHGRSRKALCFQRQAEVSWCTCDPLVVIASDNQVRIAWESFSYWLLAKQLHISYAAVFSASQHKFTVVFFERRLDFVVVFLYMLNRTIEDNECVV